MNSIAIYNHQWLNDPDLAHDLNLLEAFAQDREVQWFSDGGTEQQPGYAQLEKLINRGRIDTVVTASLYRYGQTLGTLWDTIRAWHDCGITVISLKEELDTSDKDGRKPFDMICYLLDLDQDIKSRLCKEGIARTTRNQREYNSKLTPEVRKRIGRLWKGGKQVSWIATNYHLSRNTIYNVLEEQGLRHGKTKGMVSAKPQGVVCSHRQETSSPCEGSEESSDIQPGTGSLQEDSPRDSAEAWCVLGG